MLQRAIKCDVSIHRSSSHTVIFDNEVKLVKGRLVKKSLFKSELNGDNMYSITGCEGDETSQRVILRRKIFKEE